MDHVWMLTLKACIDGWSMYRSGANKEHELGGKWHRGDLNESSALATLDTWLIIILYHHLLSSSCIIILYHCISPFYIILDHVVSFYIIITITADIDFSWLAGSEQAQHDAQPLLRGRKPEQTSVQDCLRRTAFQSRQWLSGKGRKLRWPGWQLGLDIVISRAWKIHSLKLADWMNLRNFSPLEACFILQSCMKKTLYDTLRPFADHHPLRSVRQTEPTNPTVPWLLPCCIRGAPWHFCVVDGPWICERRDWMKQRAGRPWANWKMHPMPHHHMLIIISFWPPPHVMVPIRTLLVAWIREHWFKVQAPRLVQVDGFLKVGFTIYTHN